MDKTLATPKGSWTGRLTYLNRSQLARLLWPDTPLRTALIYLQQAIDETPGLSRRLSRLGWTPKTRLFTPRMVKIVLEESNNLISKN